MQGKRVQLGNISHQSLHHLEALRQVGATKIYCDRCFRKIGCRDWRSAATILSLSVPFLCETCRMVQFDLMSVEKEEVTL